MSGATSRQDSAAQPGAALRRLRQANGLPLREVARRTGVSISVLSKVETGKLGLNARRLAQISSGLGIDVGQLFEPPARAFAPGRRSISRAGDPAAVPPAADLLHKRLSPHILQLAAGEPGGALAYLPGEVFAYVIEGEAELRTDLYAPLRLGPGDTVYFDGATGHAWASAGTATCRVLIVSSAEG